MGLAFAGGASVAELAPIVHLLKGGEGLAEILATGLAYQFGGALARWLRGGRTSWTAVALLGGVGLLAGAPGRPFWLLGVAGLAWALQAARRRQAATLPDAAPSPTHKRAARVVGFVLAAAAPLSVCIVALVGCLLAVAWFLERTIQRAQPCLSGHPIETVMVLHQMHYFTYCYGVVLILSQVAGGPGLVGLWFGLGWLTYLSAERLWAKASLPVALVAGHIVVTLTLCGLAACAHQAWATVLFWVLTGLGGGTVYCLTRLHRLTGGSSEALDVAEDVGHVGGVAFALVAVLAFGLDARGLAIVGAAFAVATIAAFLVVHPTLAFTREET